LLEERILYSATPLALLDGGENVPPESGFTPEMIERAMALFDQLSEMNQDAWGDHQAEGEGRSEERKDREESLQEASTLTNEPTRRELVLIQGGMMSSEDVIASLEGFASSELVDYDIFVVERLESGFAQIETLLAQYDNLDAIHIFSESDSGRLELGNDRLDTISIAQFHDELNGWQEALNQDGDILFYLTTDEPQDQSELSHLINEISVTTNSDAGLLTRTIDESFGQHSWVEQQQIGRVDSNVLVVPTAGLSSGNDRFEVVFVDEGLEDYKRILADVTNREQSGTQTLVFRIQSGMDGLEQINAF